MGSPATMDPDHFWPTVFSIFNLSYFFFLDFLFNSFHHVTNLIDHWSFSLISRTYIICTCENFYSLQFYSLEFLFFFFPKKKNSPFAIKLPHFYKLPPVIFSKLHILLFIYIRNVLFSSLSKKKTYVWRDTYIRALRETEVFIQIT